MIAFQMRAAGVRAYPVRQVLPLLVSLPGKARPVLALPTWQSHRRAASAVPEQLSGPLSPDEARDFRVATSRLGQLRPELARALIAQLRLISDDRVKRRLSSIHKVQRAKFGRNDGKGKTRLYAYLAHADKKRVLELAAKHGALGADRIGGLKKGKTAYFASLPGEVKFRALRDWKAERDTQEKPASNTGPPSTKQLRRLAFANGLPMVGFGFADNGVMIVFGEAIDTRFSMYISTMAAAGLGNLCSNIAGLGMADNIERAASAIGVPQHQLSAQQRQTFAARVAGFGGTAIGVTIGCLLGMFPLLLYNEPGHH